MFRFLLIAFLLITGSAIAQTKEEIEHWAHWDKKYPLTDITKVLVNEKRYADSVERDPDIPPYYFRRSGYRFKAQFLGKTRVIDSAVRESMYRLAKLTPPKADVLDKILSKEGPFKVGNYKIWMPIQVPVYDDFLNEVESGAYVTLYCAFFNEHTSANKLYNTFLISEFIAL